MQGYCFIVEGDIEALDRLCNRFLTKPSGGAADYRPLTKYVMLTFCHAAEVGSLDPPYDALGLTDETEVAFWVLTAAVKRELGVDVAQRPAWYVPYIFIDKGPNLTGGREIYGFPKELGSFDMPVDPSNPDRLAARALVVPELGKGSRASVQTIIEVNRTSPSVSMSVIPDLAAGAEAVRELLFPDKPPIVPGLHFIEDLTKDLLHHSGTLVFLRQLFDITNGASACYQSIAECDLVGTKFNGAKLLHGDFEVSLGQFASHPMCADMGLQPKQLSKLTYWVDFDFVLQSGKTVWKAL